MYSVAGITMEDKVLIIAQANADADPKKKHSFKIEQLQIEWTGPFMVLYNGKPLINENN